MAFCKNCGAQIIPGSKFCGTCGSIVEEENHNTRKTVFEGDIHKCPSCGEVLNSFVPVCPACGYEIRGARASESVHEFTYRLENARSEEQRITLIRNFPIPNTKEDIFEYMILASTNITGDSQENEMEAWLAKFEQCYKKAELVFSNDSDFTKFQSIYEQTNKQINKEKNKRVAKKVGKSLFKSTSALPRVAVAVGWLISIFILIPLCGVNVDNTGFSPYQLVLMAVFIAGAILLPFIVRGESSLPSFVTVIGLIISIAVLIPLCGKKSDSNVSTGYILVLIVDIISSIIILIRIFKKKKDKNNNGNQ